MHTHCSCRAAPLPCLTVGRAFGGVAKVEHLSGGGVDLGVRGEGVVHLAAATRKQGQQGGCGERVTNDMRLGMGQQGIGFRRMPKRPLGCYAAQPMQLPTLPSSLEGHAADGVHQPVARHMQRVGQVTLVQRQQPACVGCQRRVAGAGAVLAGEGESGRSAAAVGWEVRRPGQQTQSCTASSNLLVQAPRTVPGALHACTTQLGRPLPHRGIQQADGNGQLAQQQVREEPQPAVVADCGVQGAAQYGPLSQVLRAAI